MVCVWFTCDKKSRVLFFLFAIVRQKVVEDKDDEEENNNKMSSHPVNAEQQKTFSELHRSELTEVCDLGHSHREVKFAYL